MTSKVDNALNRLESILPLKQRQDDCDRQIKELHQQIIRSFVDKGRILSREEMADYVSNLEDAVKILEKMDMVVFAEDGEPLGAYPFTMEAREHTVQVNPSNPPPGFLHYFWIRQVFHVHQCDQCVGTAAKAVFFRLQPAVSQPAADERRIHPDGLHKTVVGAGD